MGAAALKIVDEPRPSRSYLLEAQQIPTLMDLLERKLDREEKTRDTNLAELRQALVGPTKEELAEKKRQRFKRVILLLNRLSHAMVPGSFSALLASWVLGGPFLYPGFFVLFGFCALEAVLPYLSVKAGLTYDEINGVRSKPISEILAPPTPETPPMIYRAPARPPLRLVVNRARAEA